ncbi:S-methyl-5-thioribose kinase [Glaciihabitans sp. UYNi722]|uniref:S-methyl-5-thioribose kinase n=1 Tax=Glaciihabitans sp. UYNi722 TaxID=3156344 RepID=UPI0033998650
MSTQYRALDGESVCEYVRRWRPEFEPDCSEEIGDGNLNLVFRVHGRANQQPSSIIVKQAVPYLRAAGEGWPLTLDRSRIEAEALELHGRLAPGLTPVVRLRDESMHLLILEDLVGHTVWRTSLVGGKHVAGIAAGIGRYCARTLLGTSHILMPSAERKALSMRFVNPDLCAISEDLVFTAPYIDAESNILDEAAIPIAEQLRRDRTLQQKASYLRFLFKTRAEAVIHGDLHTGSIMVAEDDPRVMDPEFAFFGPMGYDIGNLFANLAFARLRHELLGNDFFVAQVDEYASEFWSTFVEEVRSLWPATEPWRESFLVSLVQDSADFAAMEMIRRMVGLAHVNDIDTLPLNERFVARQRVLDSARLLTLGLPVGSAEDLWLRATRKDAL